jgi:hypothetical protein
VKSRWTLLARRRDPRRAPHMTAGGLVDATAITAADPAAAKLIHSPF